jgi:hypothetical protein
MTKIYFLVDGYRSTTSTASPWLLVASPWLLVASRSRLFHALFDIIIMAYQMHEIDG